MGSTAVCTNPADGTGGEADPARCAASIPGAPTAPVSACQIFFALKQPPFDASDLSRGRREVAREANAGAGSLDRLDRARERLVRWREALEAAGFRTNLSLIPPCSIAARNADGSDEHWVTVLPTGLIALELRDLGDAAATWSRANDKGGEPSTDDVLSTVRALFAWSAGASNRDGRVASG